MKKEIKIGIIISLAIILFVWGVNWLKGYDILNKQKTYYTIYERIDGLNVANPVQINGHKIGQVSDIYFLENNSGKIVVKITVDRINIDLPKNTIAKIVSTDLLGSKAIEFVFTKSDELLDNGDTLKSETQESIKDEVNKQVLPLKVKAEEMMASIDTVMVVISAIFNDKTRENINSSIKSISSTINNLSAATSTLNDILSKNESNLDKTFTSIEDFTLSLSKSKGSIERILANFDNITDSISQTDLKQTLNNINNITIQADSLLSNINAGIGTIGQLTVNDSLYINLENTSKNLDLLLEDIRLNPKRYVHFSVFGGGAK